MARRYEALARTSEGSRVSRSSSASEGRDAEAGAKPGVKAGRGRSLSMAARVSQARM